MAYKLTFQIPEENLKNAKERGKYPFPLGGIKWEQGDSHIVESLEPFYEGEKAKKHVHDFLIVEEVSNADSQETD